MRTINVTESLNNSKFHAFHLKIACWCFFIMMFDGYDLIVYGSVLPEVMKDWNMSEIQSGAIAGYTLIGMMLGALIFGTFADRFGRKYSILIATITFSLFSAMCAFANGPTDFGIYRFFTGLGLGGSLPNLFAMTSEYAPKKIRTILVGIMSTGYPLGGILAASLSIQLLPVYGWGILYLFGALPLLTIPFMFYFFPESISYLVIRKQKERVAHLLPKIDPTYSPTPKDEYEVNIPKNPKVPFIDLFRDGRALNTILIWIVVFMSLLMLFGLNTWLPKLMLDSGYPLGSSILFLVVLNVGAMIGPVIGGWLSDRWRARNVLIIYYSLAAISIYLLGIKMDMLLLYGFVLIAGATTVGSQPLTNAFTVEHYPVHMRSTGLGWALGIGRLGGILGTSLVGIILSLNLSFQFNFLAFAIPGLIAAVTLLFVFKGKVAI